MSTRDEIEQDGGSVEGVDTPRDDIPGRDEPRTDVPRDGVARDRDGNPRDGNPRDGNPRDRDTGIPRDHSGGGAADRTGDDALDAYSRVVSGVASHLIPRVAALRVRQRDWRGRSAEGAGSGVVFTSDGFLLTNAHVVGSAKQGTAAFADGTTVPFTVVGADPLSDLAVIRANGTTPPPAELGEADDLVVGQLVVAVGNPLGLWSARSAGHCRPGPAPRSA
jgi:S1-C subfamily serine protease